MSQAVTLKLLSGSTNGKGIKVTGTSSGAGVTIHTAVAGTSSIDEVTLEAVNSDTVARTLTLGWGGTTSPDNLIPIPIPASSGKTVIVDKGLLQNGLVISAWCDTANVVMVYGAVYGFV